MAEVNYPAIKKKVVDLLEAQVGEGLPLVGVKTVHYGPLVATPTNCPLVAIYNGNITGGTARIGGTRPRDRTLTFKVDCVAYSMKDWADSDDRLQALMDAVEEVLEDTDTLDALRDVGIIYAEVGDVDLDESRENGFFSGATITYKAEVRR